MALDESKRLTPAILKADQNAYTALAAFAGYQPLNSACAREKASPVEGAPSFH